MDAAAQAKNTRQPVFVDVFAGAGGLSLGLMMAGLRGLFAVEHERNAFETLRWNLITRDQPRYEWPAWLPKEPWEIGLLVKKFRRHLMALRGSVDLLAGGPPCQGFSSAGRRRRNDPRNRLFELYVEMARLLQPSFLLFENVPGIAIEFGKGERQRRNPRRIGRPPQPFSTKIVGRLSALGYKVFVLQERAVDFGVPQTRPRYLIFGVHSGLGLDLTEVALRAKLVAERDGLVRELGLPIDKAITVEEAISDLVTVGRPTIEFADSPGFRQVVYQGPQTKYHELLRKGMAPTEAPNSMRLARHHDHIVKRFERILATCRRGTRMTPADRQRFGMVKSSLTPLHPHLPSHTLTTLPDDFLHYCEPRILTVREYARLQSFPDWFAFKGKYTTGGTVRKHECPRYTQVANAVPPLLAQVFGRVVASLYEELINRSDGNKPLERLAAAV